ncbi:MAG: hypothetical protein WDZ85_03665 [Candidatus Paceibacterota bacterium]
MLDLTAKRSSLLVLAMAGLFLVTALPALAEEVIEKDSPTPVVESVLVSAEAGPAVEDSAVATTIESMEVKNETGDEVVVSNEVEAGLPAGEETSGELATSAEVSFNLLMTTEAETAVSTEVSAVIEATVPEPTPLPEIAISNEAILATISITPDPDPTPEIAISNEFNFITQAVVPDPDPTPAEIAVSGEMSFTTGDGGNGGGDEPESEIAISAEMSFRTASDGNGGGGDPTTEIAISTEMSFRTASGGNGGGGGGDDPTPEIAISNEFNFTTSTTGGPELERAISDEMSFTTASGGNGGGGGGGPSGGGGGGRIPSVIPTEKYFCEPYLKKFIRFGYDNDPMEVLKLKIFLNTFEGFNLRLTPVYDLEAFRAVEIFQMRYASDIIQPWRNLYGPTGFVYITTTLKINYIFCGVTAPIDMDLFAREDLIRWVPAAADVLPLDDEDDEDILPIILPPLDGEVGRLEESDNALVAIWQLLAGLPFLSLDFLCDWCWLVILILLLIILYLLGRNRRLKREASDYQSELNHFYSASAAGLAGGVAAGGDDGPTDGNVPGGASTASMLATGAVFGAAGREDTQTETEEDDENEMADKENSHSPLDTSLPGMPAIAGAETEDLPAASDVSTTPASENDFDFPVSKENDLDRQAFDQVEDEAVVNPAEEVGDEEMDEEVIDEYFNRNAISYVKDGRTGETSLADEIEKIRSEGSQKNK